MAIIKKVFPDYINDFYLMLTEKCPLRCQYCYIADKDSDLKMSLATIDNFVKAVSDRSPRLIFFGGEPLLEIDTIKKTVNRYKNKFVAFQVVTSGIVNLDRFIDEVYILHRDKFELQLSWDGFNDTRKWPGGKRVAEIIWQKIVTLINAGIEFQVRTVINDTNIDDFSNLYKTYESMYNEHQNFYADFTIAHQTEFAATFANKYAYQLRTILDLIETSIKNNRRPFLPQWILQILTGIINNEPVAACNVGSEIIIRPDGGVYPCTMLSQSKNAEQFCLGNINDNRPPDFTIIEQLLAKQNQCLSCDYNHACFGGCRYERVMLNDTLDSINTSYCQQTKAIYDTAKQWYDTLDQQTKMTIAKYCANYKLWTASSQSRHNNKARNFRVKGRDATW